MRGYLIGAAVIVVLLVFWEIWREIHRFIITEYEIESPKFEVNMEEKRIVFLSDLHNREYGEKNEELVGAIRAAKPDLIIGWGSTFTEDSCLRNNRFCGAHYSSYCPHACRF